MERKPVFNCRTSQMSDEMYEHVEKRIKQMPDKSFRAYAFELIEKDMNENNNQENISALIENLKDQMEREFKNLGDKIDQKSLLWSSDHAALFEKKQDIKEGIIATDEITGTINEEYEMDY